jgi:hypothetical protein
MNNRRNGHGFVPSRAVAFIIICAITSFSAACVDRTAAAEYVVHVSVDGLRSDVIGFLGPGYLPNFHRMRIAGIFTDNARNDYDFVVTLPNHCCILTGRPVLGPDGHGVSFNSDPGTTLETVAGHYIASVFDVIHDNGFSTAMYSSKSKFAFFERSWDGVNGAPDTIGTDYGRDKIDTYVNVSDTHALIDSFVLHMTESPHAYSFIHIADPDAVGHDSGWESEAYYHSVMRVDSLLGRIFDLIDEGPTAGVTAVVLTADHGGTGTSHDDPLLPENYTIPLYVTGQGVPAGYDIYAFNPESRLDPEDSRPAYDAWPQPIRNGDTSNLALELLGLGPIPGSVINADQDLDALVPEGNIPEVVISSPSDGALFDYPATIEIEAAVHGGFIVQVEFYADWTLIGEDAASPYTCSSIDLLPGEHTLSVRAVQTDGIAAVACIDLEVVSITGMNIGGAEETVLIFPNPVRKRSTVLFSLSSQEYVEMVLYDALGRRIDTVMGGIRGPGPQTALLDADLLAPGFYFYRMNLGTAASSGKILVLR